MRQVSHSSLCAVVAISAAFALGSTSVLAQDAAAAPAIELPSAVDAALAAPAPAGEATVEAVPQQKPTIVLPAAITQAAQEPKAEPAPPPSREASRRAEAPSRARSAPAPAKAAPQPATEAVLADAAPVTDEVPAADAGMAEAPVAMPEAAQPAAPGAEARRDAGVPHSIRIPDEAIAAAALGFLGLGLAGFLATRRRREDEDEAIERAQPEPVDDTPVTSIPSELEVYAAEPAPVPASAPSPALPDGEVPTGEARQRLLDEMVAAPPDSLNPFTSRAARRKRARIILQAREHRLRQQQGQHRQAGEPFDWRSFNASAVSDPADSPMVDA